MRWLALYVRSRRIPAAFAAIVVTMVAVWALAETWGGAGQDPRLVALAVTGGIAVAAVGLAGNDIALERTAAIRWLPRRATHVLLIAVVVGAALVMPQAMGSAAPANDVIVRDVAGSAGLAAFGAAVFGGQFAWTLPIGWFAITLVAPPKPGVETQVLTWLVQPPDTVAAAVIALVFGVGGTLTYAAFGCRR